MAEPQLNGCVQFNITVAPQEMGTWPAHCIEQFFNGVAQVVYAADKNAEVQVQRLNDGDTNERQG